MATRLNDRGFSHAKELIEDGRFVDDERDAWSEHRPSTEAQNRFIDQHAWREYGKWHLRIEHEAAEATKERYRFQYRDFNNAHPSWLLAAEGPPGQDNLLPLLPA